MKKLEGDGYFSSDDKRPKTYYLSQDLNIIRQNMAIVSGFLDYPDYMVSQMLNEAQRRLETLSGYRDAPDDTPTPLSVYMASIQYLLEGRVGGSSPLIPYPDSHLDSNHRDNQNIPQNIQDNGKIPINRVYCYHCRTDITELERFPATVEGHSVEICTECNKETSPNNRDKPNIPINNPDKPEIPMIQVPRILYHEWLEMFRNILPQVYTDSQNQPVTNGTILHYLEREHPDRGWNEEILKRVLGTAMRDGDIFEPRPGFYLRTV